MNNFYGAVYETTNHLNGKKYIGKVVFNRINDWNKYLGSGLYLKRAIARYGKQHFSKVLLAYADDSSSLELLEELFIKLFNAVESDEYYNLKYTSIGGDTFTNNPNKEYTRKLKSINSSGNNNPMYGRPKSQAMIDAVKKANSTPFMIDGIIYESRILAQQSTGLSPAGFTKRLRSGKYPNWFKL